MTELAVPAIGIRPRFRQWQTQNIFAPIAEVSVFWDTAGIDDVGPGEPLDIIGSGTQGRRLWIRSPGGQWTVLPVGAGEDYSLRSFNVWDDNKKRWLVATAASELLPDQEYIPDAGIVSDFKVRAPGRVWEYWPGASLGEPRYNPTPPDNPPNPEHQDYVRLAWLRERNDPEWRIVHLTSYSIPIRPPSLPLSNFFYDPDTFTYFRPHSTLTRRVVTDYYNSPTEEVVDAKINGDADPHYPGGISGPVAARAIWHSYSNQPPDSPYKDEKQQVRVDVGTVDFRAIRRQLRDKWPESNFYIGQYDPIQLKHVQRLYIEGTLRFSLSHNATGGSFDPQLSGHAPVFQEWFDNVRFKVYYQTNGPTAALDSEYQPRAATDFTPGGGLLWEQVGLAEAQEIHRENGFVAGWHSSLYFTFGMYLEGPGEDNVRFSVAVENAPSFLEITGIPTITYPYGLPGEERRYPRNVFITGDLRITNMYLHLCMPHVDVPETIRDALPTYWRMTHRNGEFIPPTPPSD